MPPDDTMLPLLLQRLPICKYKKRRQTNGTLYVDREGGFACGRTLGMVSF